MAKAMATITNIIIIISFLCTHASAANGTTLNVAIIGGGVAGAYASYALWQTNQVVPDYDINITIYEASKRLGGRARHAIIDGRTVELGASMIYGGNYYLANDLTKFGLREKEDVGNAFALFDGQRVVFRSTTQYGIVTAIQMFVRYQLSLLRYVLLPLKAFWSFTRVYTLQDGGTSFNTTTELLNAQGLLAETQTSFARYAGATPLTVEFLGAINRCNYNQRNEQLHALVGLVSTLPAFDFVQGSISIQGGNAQLARRLATHARAHVVLGHRVEAIKRSGDVWHVDGRAFDAVIIATPLMSPNSSKKGTVSTIDIVPPVSSAAYFTTSDYVSTVTNIVRGIPRIDVDALLATNGAPTNWSCVASLGGGLFKVFTRDAPLDEAALAQLFQDGAQVVAVEPWAAAYPLYRGTAVAAPFVLGEGLYYTSSIERVASAMEMSAIAGKNAALLTARYFEDTLMKQQQWRVA